MATLTAAEHILSEPPDPHSQALTTVGQIASATVVEAMPVIALAPITAPPDTQAKVPETSLPPVQTTTSTSVLPINKPKPPPTTSKPNIMAENFPTTSATEPERQYLGCIALYESGGNTTAYNGKGPYYGRYQFLQGTWDRFVVSIGRQSLKRADIRQLSGPVQDDVALQFLRAGRRTEWGTNRKCSQHLRP